MVRGEAFACAWVCIRVGQPLSPSTRQDLANSTEPKPVPNPVVYWNGMDLQQISTSQRAQCLGPLARNMAENQTETDLLTAGDWPHTICRAVRGDGKGDRGGAEQPPPLLWPRMRCQCLMLPPLSPLSQPFTLRAT